MSKQILQPSIDVRRKYPQMIRYLDFLKFQKHHYMLTDFHSSKKPELLVVDGFQKNPLKIVASPIRFRSTESSK